MSKIKLFLLISVLAGLLLLPLTVTKLAAAVTDADKEAACAGLGSAGSSCAESDAEGSVTNLIGSAINILSYIVGVASVFMLMVGGFRYITSNGDSNTISAAKNTILYAVVGLVIAAMAQLIVRFVLTEVTTEDPAPTSNPHLSLVNWPDKVV